MDSPSGMGTGGAGAPPNDNLVMAIIALLCCWPFAIPALMNATQVESKWRAGDQAGAIEAANQAKRWSTIAIGAGIAVTVLYLLFVFACGGLSLLAGGSS